jgi:hypothetical protein
MRVSVRTLALTLRQVEYTLLLPFVFCATWLEAAPPHTRETLARSAFSLAMMVAGLTGVTIIRSLFE